jgi:Ca2+-binding RTX toxin-like protein
MAARDRLIGGNDADDLYGGDGNDTIVGYTTGDFIDGGADFDSWALTGTFSTGIGLSPIIDLSSVTFFGIEAIRITWGEFLLNSNQVGGASTVQTIVAGSTDRDMLRVAMAPGATVMDLSAVNFIDWNNSGGEFDRLTLLGSAAGDTIKGSKVNEVIFAYDGANSVGGGDGDDRIVGGLQADTLRGGNGSDTLDGGGGNDILIGDEDFSADPKAGRGDDMLYGGDGDDLLFAVRGFNEIHGGTGNDTVDIGFVAQDPAEGRTPSSWSST